MIPMMMAILRSRIVFWRSAQRVMRMDASSKTNFWHHIFNPWSGDLEINGKRLPSSKMMWDEPSKWNEHALRTGSRDRVLVNPQSDLFHTNDLLLPPRRLLGDLIQDCQNLDWLLLTKRPEQASSHIRDMFRLDHATRWLPDNVWLGISVENQFTLKSRLGPIGWPIPLSHHIAKIRFVSFEPLLGPISISRAPQFDWAIIAGETGTNARNFDLAWARNLIEQLREHNIPVFVKQLGSKPAIGSKPLTLNNPNGSDPAEWPNDLRIWEFPSHDKP